MNITFVTESLNQYRTGWFDHLASVEDTHVTVLFMRVERDRPWDVSVAPPSFATRVPAVNVPLHGYGTVTFVRSLHASLGATSPDLVVLPGWGQAAAYQVARWCKRNAIPYAVLFETWTPQQTLHLPTSITDRFRRWMLDGSHLRFPAGERALHYIRSLGFTGTVVHSNVCDVDEASRYAKLREPSANGDFTVLYCGRLMEAKGVHLVLQTARLCGGDRIRFRIMGSGPLQSQVQELAAQNDSLEYLGSVAGPERFAIMAQADALLLPSLVEPWGVVVQESLAVGTPVIVSPNVGCIPEFVEQGATGIVVDTHPEAMRDAILKLRNQSHHHPSLGQQCAEAAMRHTYATAARELADAVASGI